MGLVFENDVKMYGTQTNSGRWFSRPGFENDVKMYGTQTEGIKVNDEQPFENDVKMYGTQTMKRCAMRNFCLRMM